MSPCQPTFRRGASVALVLAIVLTALPALLNAQTAPAPAPKAATMQSNDTVPKWDVFLGYQWLNPGGNVPDGTPPPAGPLPVALPSMDKGFGASVGYNFNKYFAAEGSYGVNWISKNLSNYQVQTFSAGPRATWRGDNVDFYAHTLVGLERLAADPNGSSLGPVLILGGGMDLSILKNLSLRVFEADYQWSHQNFANSVDLYGSGSLRRPNYEGALLRTGLVFSFGGAPELPVAAACSVDHSDVMVGEPVHVTVVASNFNPKHTLTYAWASSGGKIQGKDTAATVDTNGIAGGSYTATATVTDAKAKKNNSASCSVNFTVKEPPKNPPQMSCSANPTMVKTGETSTITCGCTSPDNVPVTVAGWTASGGSISGSGSTATLTTAGASSGPINVSATCTDSRGLSASASTTVTIENPPPPPPQASKVNECQYPNAKKPWRVDNTCKAELDDVALKLQQDPDAKLVVVGNADPKEKRKNLAGERALNVKGYISGGEAKQNIDASRIEVRTGNEGTATTEQWIVPAGATFPEAGTTAPVDPSVKAVPDHPKPVAKKKAKKME